MAHPSCCFNINVTLRILALGLPRGASAALAAGLLRAPSLQPAPSVPWVTSLGDTIALGTPARSSACLTPLPRVRAAASSGGPSRPCPQLGARAPRYSTRPVCNSVSHHPHVRGS